MSKDFVLVEVSGGCASITVDTTNSCDILDWDRILDKDCDSKYIDTWIDFIGSTLDNPEIVSKLSPTRKTHLKEILLYLVKISKERNSKGTP